MRRTGGLVLWFWAVDPFSPSRGGGGGGGPAVTSGVCAQVVRGDLVQTRRAAQSLETSLVRVGRDQTPGEDHRCVRVGMKR